MRVLLVDDHQLLLDGLRSLLTAHDVDVVGTARHGLECLAQARLLRPDVILMDVGIPVCDGLTATRLVKAELPEIKVIMLSAAADDQQLFEAVKSGAIGYLLKSMDADELMTALEDALNDVPPLAPSLAHRLLAEFSVPAGRGQAASASMADVPSTVGQSRPTGASPGGDHGLTDRQQDILGLLAKGLSYKEVAAQVWLTPRTVKYHVAEIMRKLHLSNRAQVLAYAGQRGLGLRPDADRPTWPRSPATSDEPT